MKRNLGHQNENYQKKKNSTSFLSSPKTPITFRPRKYVKRKQENKLKSKTKTKGNPLKQKEEGTATKLPETKINQKNDITSPSKKRKININTNSELNDVNDNSKSYQMFRKIHIPDLLSRFPDPVDAQSNLETTWKELTQN